MRLDNIRRAELVRLLRHRGTSAVEVNNEVEDILAERVRWTATALGQRVKLTLEEKDRLGIRTIACVDRTKAQMKLHYLERKRARDRRRISKVRAQTPKTTTTISPRAQQLASVLNADWLARHVLADAMRTKWRLKDEAALRMAALRAARELCERGIAEEMIKPSPRGGFVPLLRLKKSTNIDVSAKGRARSADDSGSLGEATETCSTEQRSPNKKESPHRTSAAKPDTTRHDTLH
jgi:hypothetical protein